jgi:peroxiredoxin
VNISESPSIDKFRIGEKAPYFCLPSTDGKLYSLSSFENASCIVVIFTSNHCPYAKLYESRMISLYNELKVQNVEFLAICSNDGSAFPEDSFEQMKTKEFPFPYLHDETQIVAKSFDAQATPEVFVFDKNYILNYHGAIDDNPESLGFVKKHLLRDAVTAVINNRPVETPEAPLIGCSIKWKLN